MFRTRTFAVGAAVVGIVIGLAANPADATGRHIVAKPSTLKVNATTTLTGTGFPANTRLPIAECSKTSWATGQFPCNSSTQFLVVTDSHGHFVHKLKVTLCGGKRGPTANSQICFVGQPRPTNAKTVGLLGAVKVTVTH